MSEIGFDVSQLDKFSQKLLETAQHENPKLIKKFMRKEGSKLRSRTAKKARAVVKKGKKDHDKSYHKSIKRGKPYKYGDEDAIRAYSYAPHAHLIEDGHRLISHGKEIRFVPGKHVFQDSGKEFAPTFQSDAQELLSEIARTVEK